MYCYKHLCHCVNKLCVIAFYSHNHYYSLSLSSSLSVQAILLGLIIIHLFEPTDQASIIVPAHKHTRVTLLQCVPPAWMHEVVFTPSLLCRKRKRFEQVLSLPQTWELVCLCPIAARGGGEQAHTEARKEEKLHIHVHDYDTRAALTSLGAWPPHHYEQRKLNFTPSQLTNPSVINKQHFHQQHLIHWFHRAQKIWFSTCVCCELCNQCTCVM